MLSDSQMSTDKIEFHGVQKQFVGNDFLLGGAGSGGVIAALFTSLRDPATGDCTVDSSQIGNHVLDFLDKEVTQQARATVSFLLVCPEPTTANRIDVFLPATFRSSMPGGNYSTLGSGSELVRPAIARDTALGIFSQPKRPVDMLVVAENYLDAATQSLTVDAQYTVGVLHAKRAYIMGDERIGAIYVPRVVRSHWKNVATRYKTMMDQARLIRGEIREAQRALSKIQKSKLDSAAIQAITANQNSIATNRQQLQNEIEQYFVWYDNLLGR